MDVLKPIIQREKLSTKTTPTRRRPCRCCWFTIMTVAILMLSRIHRISSASAASGRRFSRTTKAAFLQPASSHIRPCPIPVLPNRGTPNRAETADAIRTNQRRYSMAEAMNNNDNNDIDESTDSQQQQRRGPPPTLDSFDYDEGFGGYDYQPDLYDTADMESQDVWEYDNEGILVPKTVAPAPEPQVIIPPSPPSPPPQVQILQVGQMPEEQAQGQASTPSGDLWEYDEEGMLVPKAAPRVQIPQAVQLPEEHTKDQEEISSSSEDLWEYDDQGVLVPKEAPQTKESSLEASSSSSSGDLWEYDDEGMLIPKTAPTMEPTLEVQGTKGPPLVPTPTPSPTMTVSNTRNQEASSEQPFVRDAAFYRMASYGNGVTTDLDLMEKEMAQLTQDMLSETNNDKFNPNSPRQVSEALYGTAGESTSKDVLEGMAASGSKLADLVIQFRQLKSRVNKWKKRKENKANGTFVQNVHEVKRASPDQQQVQAAAKREPTSPTIDSPTIPSSLAEEESDNIADSKHSQQPEMDGPHDALLLVDASAYIYRAYYAYPPLHRADGTPIGAVLGFCNMLNRLVLNMLMKGEQPRIVLVFDAPGKTFRHDIYDLYKANRDAAPVDLVPQFALVREVAKAYGIVQLEAPSYEADDVIATLATMALKEGVDVNVLSGDKDLMQLVTPTDVTPSIQMIDPVSMSRVSYEDVIEKWGVTPELLGDVLALAGDSSDNIPGVPGIGPKIAATLLESFGTLEGILENVEDVKQKGRREKLQNNIEQARLSRVLVELERNVPSELMTFPEGFKSIADLRMAPMDEEKMLRFFDEMGLRDLKRRFESRLQVERGVRGNPPARSAPRSRFAPRPKAGIPKPEDFSDVPF